MSFFLEGNGISSSDCNVAQWVAPKYTKVKSRSRSLFHVADQLLDVAGLPPDLPQPVPDAPLAVVHEGDDPSFVKNEGEEQKVPMVKKAFNKVLFNLGNSKRRTQIAEVTKTGDEFSSDHVLTGAPGEVVKRSWIV